MNVHTLFYRSLENGESYGPSKEIGASARDNTLSACAFPVEKCYVPRSVAVIGSGSRSIHFLPSYAETEDYIFGRAGSSWDHFTFLSITALEILRDGRPILLPRPYN